MPTTQFSGVGTVQKVGGLKLIFISGCGKMKLSVAGCPGQVGPGTQAPPADLNHIKHGGTKRCHNYHACASCMEAIPCICLNYVMAREVYTRRQFQTLQDVEYLDLLVLSMQCRIGLRIRLCM